MSVVVRMEMPYSCTECRFNVDGWCYAISEHEKQPSEVHYLTRPEWCPIICSLPEGHGRLVDADAFISTIRPLCEEDKFAACTLETVKRLMVEHINNAPTIVPAEAERSEL